MTKDSKADHPGRAEPESAVARETSPVSPGPSPSSCDTASEVDRAKKHAADGIDSIDGIDEKANVSADTSDEDVIEAEMVSREACPGAKQNVAPDLERSVTAQKSSRRVSAFVRTAGVIPRSERRGLFGSFAVIPEVEWPYDYKNSTKWTITAIVALAGAGAPMGSGIFYPAIPALSADLQAPLTTTNLTVAFYMLAMSIFPLWWSSFSETLGRRTIYLVSFSLFVVFSALSAVSTNISMLIVMRILGGGASASVQAVGAGTIADLWEPAERGRAMGLFYLGPLMGPLFAPLIGGALTEPFGWRSTMWFLAIYGAVMLLMLFFGLPETLAKRRPLTLPTQGDGGPVRRVSTVRSISMHTRRAAVVARRFFIEPLGILMSLRYPPVLLTVFSGAMAFGSLFVLNISIQSTFSSAPYNFAPLSVGLLYLAPSLGYVVASLLGGRWIDYIMQREARKAARYDADGNLIFLPEDRMRENMWLAASLYPGALIWYGWTAEKQLPWAIPCVGSFFFGVGTMLVFGAVTTALTEFMPKRSASAVAVNNFVRNIFSCVGAVVAQPLLDVLGNGRLCTVVGVVAWVTANLSIWALRRWGPMWRVVMDEKMKD